MDGRPPFSGDRELLGLVQVMVPRSVIHALPPGEQRDIVEAVPLPALGADAKVHVDVVAEEGEGGERFEFLAVEVRGVPLDADVWLRAALHWAPRNWMDTLDLELWEPPHTRELGPWLQGDGRLGLLLLGHTRGLAADVSVYGPAADPGAAGRLGPDLGALRPLAELADVELRAGRGANGGGRFPAHANVLAARSLVLRALLQPKNDELADADVPSEPVVVEVDCSAEALDAFLQCLYSGELSEAGGGLLLLELLKLSDRYAVRGLHQECVRQLLRLGLPDAMQVFAASLLQASVPAAVRLHAASVVRANWAAVAASDAWRHFLAEQPVVGLAIESVLAAAPPPTAP